MAKRTPKEILAANIISVVLHPILFLILMCILMVKFYDLSFRQVSLIFFPFLLPVFSYIFLAVAVFKTTDIDFSDVKTRRPLLLIGLLGFAISMVLTNINIPVLSGIMMRVFILLVIATAVTYYWKISFHSIFFTLFVVLLIKFVSPLFGLLLLLLPLLYWARIVLNKHRLSQLVLGSLICLIVLI